MSNEFKRSAYDLEFFEFTAEQLSNERRNLILMIFDAVLDVVISKIATPAAPAEMFVQEKNDVATRMHNACEDKLKIIEALDQKYFTIPDHILLPSYFEFAKKVTPADEAEVTNEFDALSRTFKQNAVILKALQLENSKYESISQLMEQELKLHEQIELICKTHDFNKLQNFIETQVLTLEK